MKRFSMSVRAAARAAAVVLLCAAGAASAGEVRVLLGVDPADSTGDVLLSASLAPAQSLSRVTGQRTTIAQTSTMADVMRASRTVENEIIIAPAHVTASAILHAYQLLATSGQDQVYALVVRDDIDSIEKLPKQAPLPAAAGLAAQLRRQGPAHRVRHQARPVLQGDLRQHQRRRAGRAVVRHCRRHGRRRSPGQGVDRRASGPGPHPEDDPAGPGRHEHGRFARTSAPTNAPASPTG